MTEADFYKKIKQVLSRVGRVVRLESHSSNGIPDIYIMYPFPIWLELKWNGSLSGDKHTLKVTQVHWRPGQRAFSLELFSFAKVPVITLVGCLKGIYLLRCTELLEEYPVEFIEWGDLTLLKDKLLNMYKNIS